MQNCSKSVVIFYYSKVGAHIPRIVIVLRMPTLLLVRREGRFVIRTTLLNLANRYRPNMSHEDVGSFQRASLLHTNMFRLAHPLLLLLLAYQLVAQAADAPSNSPHEEAPADCVDGCSKRTPFNIIWGCLSTTIICAWAAIHPNIPPREGAIKGTLRKLELMFWTIMAPEILPAWALNQLLAAKTVRDVYNEGKGMFLLLLPMNVLMKPKVRL